MKPQAIVLLLACGAAAASERHQQLIAATPCLYEYRAWHFTFRRPAEFPRPREFTAEQCEAAALLHQQIQAEQEEEDSPTGQARTAAMSAAEAASAAAAIAAAQAAYEASPAGRAAAAQRKRETDSALRRQQDERARQRAEEAARKAQAARPNVRLGMTAREVVEGTWWGAPAYIHKRTDAAGTVEIWTYSERRSLTLQNGKVAAIYE